MPTIFSAKDIAEEAIRKIGRIPSDQAAANPKDMVIALRWLEIILQSFFGTASVTSSQGTLRIPLVAGVSKYPLVNYATTDGVQFVFDAEIVNTANGAFDPCPVKIVGEAEFRKLNAMTTGIPCVITIDKGVRGEPPLLEVHPMLGPEVADGNFSVLIQVQTFAPAISEKGLGIEASKFYLRPTYYEWAITRLAYQLGTGTLRRLPKGETDGWKVDYEEMENKLTGFDAPENSNQPFTRPWGQ